MMYSHHQAKHHHLKKYKFTSQATAAEVQKLLVSGRKQEALQFAQEGQLWGPALVLAAQLGDRFYAETVKHMALTHLVAGSPFRTLFLLIADQRADVFSTDSTAVSGMTGPVTMSQQPAQVYGQGKRRLHHSHNQRFIQRGNLKDWNHVIHLFYKLKDKLEKICPNEMIYKLETIYWDDVGNLRATAI
ncbi:RGPR-related [Striga asiatica]|uniref:RGPR-related n=1 Tax=Striga asiatica TaxID=4170 RepID=A0A5A7PAW4_STRAF|nr:RGPR-related [Striga asiatica]